MARSYQVSCPPSTATLVADLETLGGGARVTILNSHATSALYLGGDENQGPDESALTASTGFKVAAGSSYTTVLNGGEAIYAYPQWTTVTVTATVFRTNARIAG